MWEENTLKLLHPPTVNQVNLDNKESKVSESFIYLSEKKMEKLPQCLGGSGVGRASLGLFSGIQRNMPTSGG